MAKEDLEGLESPGTTLWQRIYRTSRWHGQIMGGISDDGQCDKAVLPSVFPEHLEGLRSKVRYLQNYCKTEKRTAAKWRKIRPKHNLTLPWVTAMKYFLLAHNINLFWLMTD